MAKINVILEAKARDKGTRKYLRQMTALADGLAESAAKASRATGKMALPLEGLAAAGGPRGRGGRSGGRSGGGRSKEESKRAKLERDFNRALEERVREGKRQAKLADRQARAARKTAKNIEEISNAQLVELEVQKEINRRRRRAAKQAAQKQLGPDPTRRPDTRGRLEVAENLATIGGEFEQFGDRVEQGLRGSFDAFKDYEKAVAEVATLGADISTEEISAITEAAATEFGGLPVDQVRAFYSIVSAGATDAASAQEQLIAANKLAIGGVAEQEEAVLAISKSVANFGDQGVTATDAADSLFTAVKRGQTTVSEMARALPRVAQAAADSGLTMDQTNAALAVLSTRFASANEASSGLRQALSNIAKPTKGARDEAKRLGIDFSTAGIEAAGGIDKFLIKLRDAEKFDENTLAKLFDSTEARAAVSGLISGMDEYTDVLEDMESKQGAADTAFATMSETSAQKAAKLEAQWELLKIQAGEALVPALTDLSKALLPTIEAISDFIKDNPKLAGQLAKLAIGAAAFGKVAGTVSSGLSMWNALAGAGSKVMGNMNDSLDDFGTKSSKAGKAATGLKRGVGMLPAAFVAAELALLAFNATLDEASKPLEDYQKTIDETIKAQEKIEFIDPETGEERTEQDIRREQRERLVQQVEATRTQAAAAREGDEDGIGRFLGSAFGGLAGFAGDADAAVMLNRFTGVTEEFDRQAKQAELDLARFDREFGTDVGLEPGQQFTTGGAQGVFGAGGTFERIEQILAEQLAEQRQLAGNTSADRFAGPSMDAGMGA